MAIKLWDSTNATGIGNLFRDQYGYIHIVGNGNYDATTELFYAISTDGGATFTDGEGGGTGSYKTLDSLYYGKRPDIVVDSNDNIFIFCADHNDNLYYIKKISGTGGTWGSKVLIGDKTQTVLYAEIDNDDNLIVFASDGSNRTIFTSVDAGDNWVEEVDTSFSGNIQDICLGYNQHVWGIYNFQSGGNYKTVINKLTKSEGTVDSWAFGADETESTDTYQINSNAIICERDSETIWAFVSRNIGGTYKLQYKKKVTGAWGSWIDIVSDSSNYWNISAIRNYDNEIYVFYHRDPNTLYYVKWDGNEWSGEVTLKNTARYIRIEHGELASGVSNMFYIYNNPTGETWIDQLDITLEIISKSDTISLSDNLTVNTPQESIILNDTIYLSDNIQDWRDIIHDFRIAVEVETDIKHDIRLVIESISDMTNSFNMAYAGELKDIESDIRYVTEPTYDIMNDFRMLKQWQVPGEAGFQSLGKEYIKVYINGSADDDVDIDSITIHKVLNSSHIANFIIGRPYDTVNKPTIEHEVEIRYYEKNWGNYWLLYKGYITQISPGDDPDSLKVNCQDQYWLRNRQKKYFYIGHKPADEQDLYYESISEGLSICGFNGTNIGNFIPQTMSLFGKGESDCITSLITNAGNYGWFYDVDGDKKLWTADRGSIINLERQELDKNIGLYQVLKHSFIESIENLVNKLRVGMGDKILRRFNDYGGNKEYDGYYYYLDTAIELTPAWDSEYERLATDDYAPASIDGEGNEVAQVGTSGVFHHAKEENELYKNVYTKYTIPFVSFIPEGFEAYTDRFAPKIFIHAPTSSPFSLKYSGGEIAPEVFSPVLDEGYTIDYKNNTVTFGERKYFYAEEDEGKISSIRKPNIELKVWKQRFQSKTSDPSDDPQNPGDITSPLVFITEKIGDYPETIWGSLQLSGLGIQVGGWTITGYDEDDNPIREHVPSWNDTAFAYDLAYWNLSNTCDKKINGSIDLTIDAICHYEIDLAKRIMINEVLENPLNIKSMTYTLNNFTVSLELQNDRYYKRSVSIQSRTGSGSRSL